MGLGRLSEGERPNHNPGIEVPIMPLAWAHRKKWPKGTCGEEESR